MNKYSLQTMRCRDGRSELLQSVSTPRYDLLNLAMMALLRIRLKATQSNGTALTYTAKSSPVVRLRK